LIDAFPERSEDMISRQWRGLARHSQAESYIEHLRTETFPKLAAIPGFRAASILRRYLEHGVEFLIVTQWDSIESIQKFAGRDSEVAVVPEKVQQMMIEYDRTVRHYEVVG
jgi:heme-degrading monooxygenase HmoA